LSGAKRRRLSIREMVNCCYATFFVEFTHRGEKKVIENACPIV